jgi:hypothetical protein
MTENIYFAIAQQETDDIEQIEKQLITFRQLYRTYKKQAIRKLFQETIFLLNQEAEDCRCRRKHWLNYGRKIDKCLKTSATEEPQSSLPELAGLTK